MIAGFEITMEGIRPTDKYIEAIRNFPTPTNISEVRSWFGLINQVAYSFIKTEHMAPFYHLLSQSQPFVWDEEEEKPNSQQQFINSEYMNQKMKRRKLQMILRTGSSITSQNL
jgi:hypothetical protein